MITIILFLLSIGMQLAAAIYALLLVRVTGRKTAWIVISVAMVLMTWRRVVSFVSLLTTGTTIVFDLPEVISLVISFLLLLGVLRLRNYFLSIHASEAERERAEQRLAAQYAVARVLAESLALADAAPRLLQVICENLGWELGELWSVDRDAKMLRCAETWHVSSTDASEFIAYCRLTGFAPGVGLPGRVWQSGRSVWIADVTTDANFPRATMAGKAGLHSAFAFPVMLGSEILGVMTFFVREMREPDEELLKMLSTIVSQIGQFIERRKAEEALRESQELYRLLTDSSNDLIALTDFQGRVVFISPSIRAMMGLDPAQVIGANSFDFVNPEDAPSSRESLARALAGETATFIHRGRHADGTWRWLDGWGQVVQFQGKPHVLIVTRDMTERQRAEEALRKAHNELEQRVVERTKELSEANVRLKELDRLKSLFIASMSHELRTPLNSVIGFSSILVNEWMGPLNDEQKENLSAILRSGKHLLALINDVIDVSKVEAGKVEAVVEDFDLSELLSEAVTAFTKDIKEKGLVVKLEAVQQQMRTDRRRLLQCVLNLVSNAVKFTEKGSVRVAAQLSAECGVRNAEFKEERPYSALATPNSALHGNCITISVIDTGIGIREEDIPKLYRPFVRLISTPTANIPGTGLGLYLTKRLVTEVLKGDILCISRYGEGSTFKIRMPL